MDNRGQSLLEIVVALGVIAVIVVGLTLTTVIGLRNSHFSKTQAQATKLAREALEKVKIIKERDLAVCGPSSNKQWSELWAKNLITECPPSGECKFIFKDLGAMSCSGPSSVFWLEQSASPESLTGTDFKRQVIVADESVYGATQKRVTALITWNDITGAHESRIVTILAK